MRGTGLLPQNFRCKLHGGASPQAIVAARGRELALAAIRAEREWLAVRGTNREQGKFYAACDALNAWERHEARAAQLRELRDELARREAERRAAV